MDVKKMTVNIQSAPGLESGIGNMLNEDIEKLNAKFEAKFREVEVRMVAMGTAAAAQAQAVT